MDRTLEPERPSGVRSTEKRATDADPQALLDGVRRGDADAFEQLARAHSPRLYRVALRLCGRPDEAEDLVQETLVRALPALRRFEGRARLSTYLVRALGNLWKNRLRSRSRSPLVAWFRGRPGSRDGHDVGEPEPPSVEPSALDLLEARDRAKQVRAALARLDPDRRLALVLREVEELSYEDIATVTAVPVGTVRSRLARAREDLRRLLERER